MSGAGVSAESGLSTYRDNGGLWDGIDPYEVASAEAWERQPAKYLNFTTFSGASWPRPVQMKLTEQLPDWRRTI